MTAHLSGGLVQAQIMPELLLRDSTRRVDLVAEDKEWNLRELLDGQQRVQLSLGLGEALNVNGVDEEDDAVDLREVVSPEPAGCRRLGQCARSEGGTHIPCW